MPTEQNTDEKIIVITGGNSGIGKATAKALARAGATVIIACRDAYKAHDAVAEIQADTGSSKVEFMPLDLADFNSIRNFTQLFLAKYSKLHVLINNAGVIFLRKNLTENGFEAQFGINHLGHFLLTNLLLDTLKKSAPSRIITVSSA
ncbi:MAG TPA: SDR family NAD(P)-dependent oxidoreductase, partial [Pseudomonadales bacterium]|nr:SDR family NAD(P)-dependent oxidoreductase [Pseudomonadales bacterium]